MKRAFVKYDNIVNHILDGIENQYFKMNDQLPSLLNLASEFNVSRDTVVKAYKELQMIGAITAYPGKGYFVSGTNINREKKIFMMFDVFTPYKEVLYNGFLEGLKNKGSVELFFHNYNAALFEKLLHDNSGKYTDYIIIPILGKKDVASITELSHNNKVYILDTGKEEIGNELPSVCQDFKSGLYDSLEQGIQHLKKYNRVNMVLKPAVNFSEKRMVNAMKEGFTAFCRDFKMQGQIQDKLKMPKAGVKTCYVLHDDNDLITLIEYINANNLKISHDIGVISYNETPLKKIVKNGITTISSDFREMGLSMAEMILKQQKKQVSCNAKLTIRNSI